MLDNKQLVVTIAHRVFPSMEWLPTGWVARMGPLEVYLGETGMSAQILVVGNGSPRCSIEASGNRVKVISGDETRRFEVNDPADVPTVAEKIRAFLRMR